MQISVEETSKLSRKVTIVVPAEKVDSEEKKQIVELSKKAKIDGFRPGHVPKSLIEKQYGKQIRSEAVSKTIETTLFEALKEKELNPVNEPSVENIENQSGKDLQYTVIFDIFPEVTLKDFSEIKIKKVELELSDKDVEQQLDKIKDQLATYKEIDSRPAVDGDKVNIDYEGYLGEEQFEGGTSAGVDLILGSNSFIPGFEEGLIDHKIGDSFDLPLTFPAEYHSEKLAGQEVVFKVKVNSISEKIPAEVNEEFAKKVGVEDGDVAKINERVSSDMKKHVESKIDSDAREEAIEKLAKLYEDMELPESMIERQKDALLQQQNKKIEDLSDEDKVELAKEAEQSVRVSLVLNEIIKKNNLQVDEERVKDKIRNIASMYGNIDMIMKLYRESKELMSNVSHMVLTEQATDIIVDGATIEIVKKSFDEIVNGAQA